MATASLWYKCHRLVLIHNYFCLCLFFRPIGRPTLLIARDKRVFGFWQNKISFLPKSLRTLLAIAFLIAEKADFCQRVKVNRLCRLRYSFNGKNQAVGKRLVARYCAFVPECRSQWRSHCSHVYRHKASGGFVSCKFNPKQHNSLRSNRCCSAVVSLVKALRSCQSLTLALP